MHRECEDLFLQLYTVPKDIWSMQTTHRRGGGVGPLMPWIWMNLSRNMVLALSLYTLAHSQDDC